MTLALSSTNFQTRRNYANSIYSLLKVSIVLTFFAELIGAFLRYVGAMGGISAHITLFVKIMMALSIFAFYISKNIRIPNLIFFLGFFIFLSSFSVLYNMAVLPDFGFSKLSNYSDNFILLFKLFAIVLFYFFADYSIDSEEKAKSMLKFLLFIFFLYSVSIVFSAIFKISAFSTYGIHAVNQHPGYKGIVYAGNELSIMMLLSMFAFFSYLLFYNSKLIVFFLCVVWFSCLSIGTKIGLFDAFIFPLIFFSYVKKSKGVFYIIPAAIILSLFFMIFSNWFEKLINLYSNRVLFHGYQQAFFSGRTSFVADIFSKVNTFCPWVYLFGGFPIGYKSVEMDIFNLILLGGIPLLFLIYYIYIRILFKDLSLSPAITVRAVKIFTLSFFCVSMFAGHTIMSGEITVFFGPAIVSIKRLRLNRLRESNSL